MFKLPKILVLILGVLGIGITLFTGMQIIPPGLRISSFWYTLSGLMVAEALLLLTFMDIDGKQTDRALPYRIGNILISIFYLLFTFIMIIPYRADASVEAIRLGQIIGLFAALVLHALFGLARQAVSSQSKQFAFEQANRKMFKIEIESFKIEHSELLQKSPELRAGIQELSDAVRFASESVNGAEAIDSQIETAIEQLKTSAKDDAVEPQELSQVIRKLLNLFQKRQILIKELR